MDPILLSSTAGSKSGEFDLVAISSVDGKPTTLMRAAQGESLLRPTFFGESALPSMPRSGVEGEQPTPMP